jgi:hypothetical protein
VIGPTQRPLPDNTQHSQQTDIHAPGGIRTRNPSKPAAADQRIRPRGHCDRQLFLATENTYSLHSQPPCVHMQGFCVAAEVTFVLPRLAALSLTLRHIEVLCVKWLPSFPTPSPTDNCNHASVFGTLCRPHSDGPDSSYWTAVPTSRYQGYGTVRHETTNSVLLLLFIPDGTTNRQVVVLATYAAVSLSLLTNL